MMIEIEDIQRLGNTLKGLCGDLTCYPLIDKIIVDVEAKLISTYEGEYDAEYKVYLYPLEEIIEDLLEYSNNKNKNLTRVLLVMRYYNLYYREIKHFINFPEILKECYTTYPFSTSLSNATPELKFGAHILRFKTEELERLNAFINYENDFKIKDLSLIEDYAYIKGKDSLWFDVKISKRGMIEVKKSIHPYQRGDIKDLSLNKPVPLQHMLLTKIIPESCNRYKDPEKRYDYIVKSFKALFN